MAAIRSALMLGRRSCSSSGYTAAASLGGTCLEKVFRPAARRTPPLPSLRPSGHSLEVSSLVRIGKIGSTLMLGRRSCSSSGSTAAASLGGTGLEKVFRPAARRTPSLPSFRPAGHSLESYRRFSTEGRVPADKTENWWQRCIYRIKNADLVQISKFCFWYAMIVSWATLWGAMKIRREVRGMR